MVNETLCGFAAISIAMSGLASAMPDERRDYSRLAKSIDTAVEKKALPSIVAVIFDDRRVLWSRTAGYSDVASKTTPSLQTRYRLGSMAKAVTSTVLMIAEQRGKTSFDFKTHVRSSTVRRQTSLDELVNMQAGLAQAVCYDGISGEDDPCGLAFADQFAVSIVDGRDRYSYSNMGPQLAADALAKQLNESFEQVARDLLFLPAHMSDTTFDHTPAAAALATSYDRDGKAYEHDFRIFPAAGAGLEGSAEDLVRFAQLHLTGRLPDGRQLLTATSLARLHSAPNGGFYGYGWGRIGAGTPNEVLISDGQVNGGQAMLLINPVRKIGALVLSNAAHDEVSGLAIEAIDTVVPGTAASFAVNVQRAQAAHETRMAAFLPPPDFNGAGSILIDGKRLRIKAAAHDNWLTAAIEGNETQQQPNSEVDEGFRGWAISCPSQIRACRQPGATAKLWLSRGSGGLSGQLQVTSFNGQLPFPVRLSR